MSEGRRRLAAIMFTDMVGYSALAQANEATALAVLDRHNRLLRPIFATFAGREVKTVGDAFLVEFDSALEATRCAVAIQGALAEYNASATEDWRIRIRIGIHVGEVVPTHGDVLGDAVNIASRIQPLAEPGGICLSQQVYDQVENKLDVAFEKLPPARLKNIRLPLSVWRILPGGDRGAGAAAPADGDTRHLAVLPLANISPDPGDGYFADGLTEELISVLSQVRGLSVIARTSVTPYKNAPKSIAEVGRELGVDTVLEGSVRKAGTRIRITLQLIDVASQRHIWASSYNREVDDVFAVQADIAGRTAEALRLQLAPSERPSAARRGTQNPAAYDLYLRGLVASSERHKHSYEEAVRFFERATELDPTFAEAYAAWAQLYVTVAGDVVAMRKVIPRARELVDRALALDPNSSDAHAALANLIFQSDHDWSRAEAEFQTAIALNPSNVAAYRFYALLNMALARWDLAKENFRQVVRLDPSGGAATSLAWAEFESGNGDEAIRLLRDERTDPADAAGHHNFLGLIYLATGHRAEAVAEADSPMPGATEEQRFDRALLNALIGRPKDARDILAEVARREWKSYMSRTYLAMLLSVLGEAPTALDLLEADYVDGERVFWLWYRGLFFDPIRRDPRFVALLRRYGLPTDPIPNRLV
ncbi:MAG TPA: adenylate/guanylate cyclase domain-containing protein [Thermoplasmata archaeon]|nr:adenylate/guanylate cyclase domain-containing protein [Thermoplasmata archaeon]